MSPSTGGTDYAGIEQWSRFHPGWRLRLSTPRFSTSTSDSPSCGINNPAFCRAFAEAFDQQQTLRRLKPFPAPERIGKTRPALHPSAVSNRSRRASPCRILRHSNFLAIGHHPRIHHQPTPHLRRGQNCTKLAESHQGINGLISAHHGYGRITKASRLSQEPDAIAPRSLRSCFLYPPVSSRSTTPRRSNGS